MIDITICGSAETLCDSYDITFREETAAQACDAASDIIRRELGMTPKVDSVFRNWNGGKYDNGRVSRFGFIAVQFGGMPLGLDPELYRRIETACWRAHGAMQKILVDNSENVS